MTAFDLIGAACWLLMWVAFVMARSRVALFNVTCTGLALVMVVSAVLVPGTARGPADTIATAAGLVFSWIGLLILRAMLTRSVSLHLLIAQAHPSHDAAFDDRIGDRVREAVRWRLVRSEGDRLALAPLGVGVARVLARLFLITRVP